MLCGDLNGKEIPQRGDICTRRNYHYIVNPPYCVGEDSWEFLGLQGDQTQSIWKEISPGYSLEGLMLKLKLKYFGHLVRRTDSFEKKPWCWERFKAGGEGDDRRWDGWTASQTQWTWVWVNSGSLLPDGQGGLACCSPIGSQRVGHDWVTELNRTDTLIKKLY